MAVKGCVEHREDASPCPFPIVPCAVHAKGPQHCSIRWYRQLAVNLQHASSPRMSHLRVFPPPVTPRPYAVPLPAPLQLGPSCGPREHDLTREAIMQDEKNYHAWAHRQAVVKVGAATCVLQDAGASWACDACKLHCTAAPDESGL